MSKAPLPGVRVEPEQARLLGLRAGETITAVVTQRQDGNVLLVGKQRLPIPDRMNLPLGQVSLLVRIISGQPVLALTDPALAAQVAAAHQRTDSDGRFARLLSHVGSFHLSRLFSPDYLPTLAAQLVHRKCSVDWQVCCWIPANWIAARSGKWFRIWACLVNTKPV